MKILLLHILLLLSFTSAYNQSCKTLDRKSLMNLFERYTYHPNNAECNHNGIGILKIYKESDSIKISSIYYSCIAFDFSTQKSFLKALNKDYKDSITENCMIIFPILYNTYDKDSLTKPSTDNLYMMQKNIDKFRKQKNVIVFDPIEETYPAIIHVDHLPDPAIIPTKN